MYGQPCEVLRSASDARPGGAANAAGPGVRVTESTVGNTTRKHNMLRDATSELVVDGTGDRGASFVMFCSRGTRVEFDAVLANRIAKHSLCYVGLVGATGMPTHVLVAAEFQVM